MLKSHLLAIVATLLIVAPATAQRQMEFLNRGVAAVRDADGKVFVSWRLLASDAEGVAFNLYRHADDGDPVKVNAEPLAGATNLVDEGAPGEGKLAYSVRPVVDGKELDGSVPIALWDKGFLEVPIKPLDGYRPGDASSSTSCSTRPRADRTTVSPA
jgi:rhamnogalacturonan endolyase